MAKINLLLQLQRQKLLQENKERAGQNRSAKEDRSRTTKTADKASAPPATTPAAQAKQEEDARKKRQLSGGSLDLYKRRRPAATGDDEEFRFFGITKREPFVLPNSTVSFSGEWTATAESNSDFVAGTHVDGGHQSKKFYSAEQRTNSYEYNTSVVAPKLFEELGASEKKYINMPEVQFPFSLQFIHWTLDQASAPPGNSGAVYGTPPVLAPSVFLQLSLFRRARGLSGYDIPYVLRSDGRYIYYSIAVQTAKTTKLPSYFAAGTRDLNSLYESFSSGSPTPGRDFFSLVGPDNSFNNGASRKVDFNEGETYTMTSGILMLLRPAIRNLDVFEYEFGVGYPSVPGDGSGRNIFTGTSWNGNVWNYGSAYWSSITETLTPSFTQTDVAIQGLYWRYDTEAENPKDAISFRQVDLSNLGTTYATRKSTLSNYLDNQDISNPIRIIWEHKKSLNTASLPLPDLASSFTFANQNTLTIESYPENFVYNQSTGIATEVLGSDVYTIQLAENLAYEIAASTAKNTPKSEWEASTPYDTAQSTDPDTYIRFAHLST